MSSVKVAVRVRPFNSREKERNAELIVQMNGKSTVLTRPAELRVNPTAPPTPEDEKSFTFDHSYWSFNSDDSHFATQKTVFDDLGVEVLKNAWEGFNCSIFAYGQTGSGKSYSMLGYGEEKGIIPLVCEEMFERIKNSPTQETVFKVEVSFMEIYNEKVKDLLNPKNNKAGGLKVRNNPATGPYVEDLSKLAVKSFQEIDMLMDEGSKARTVASTNMNATSSRSHAVFTIVFTQTKIDKVRGTAIDRVSKISLVDLAGSERANSTGATGVRLKEGANINKSLSTLGKVISALAENSTSKKAVFVPYRDSVLTYLLKESLGGNSKTIMIAAISPADINYEETLSTLRYADSAKKIKTVAVVNEDPQSKLIRELQSEVEKLKQLMGGGGGGMNDHSKASDEELLTLHEKIEQYEKIMAELNKSWEEKLSEAERIREDRKAALKDMGVAIKVVSSIPHLINLNEDPLMSESLVYYIREGLTKIGRESDSDIILNGLNIHKEHCVLENDNGVVTISPPTSFINEIEAEEAADDGQDTKEEEQPKVPVNSILASTKKSNSKKHSFIFVNGIEITHPTVLTTGNRVILGNNHIFRYNNPEEAARIAKERAQGAITSSGVAGDSPSDQIVDYDFALNELASIQGSLALSKHISDKQEYKKQMKALYDQIRQQMESDDFDPESKEHRERLAIMAIRKWRSKVHRSKLLNKISFLILSLNEANGIAAHLNKNVLLSLKLFSVYPDSQQISDSADLDIDWRNTQVLIKATKTDTGETTLLGDQEFVDKIYSMRELYQNDGNLASAGIDQDPFKIPFSKDSLIGVSHVYLKNALYLLETKRPVPILDANGSQKGYLNLLVSSSSSNYTQDDRNSFLMSNCQHNSSSSNNRLVGKNITINISFDGITELKENKHTGVYLKFQFPTTNSQDIDTEHYQTTSVKDSKTIVIPQLSESIINQLEHNYIAIEVWGKKSNNNNVADKDQQQSLMMKQPMLENFDFLASLNILESDESSHSFKPVHILEDPDIHNSAVPSVTFRLKKDHSSRQILLKILKNETDSGIVDCKSAKITDLRVLGKSTLASTGPNATPSTPSTPSNPRGAPMTPMTPGTPYNGSNSGNQNNSNAGGNNSTINGTNNIPSVATGGSGALTTPLKESLITNSSSNSSSQLLQHQVINLPIASVTEDSVLLSWDNKDSFFNQKTRKGDKIIFKLTFELAIKGFQENVLISKDMSIKILSTESMINMPDGSNSSMSNLLDKFKTHFKGESILSEPSIHAGSVFNIHLTKSRQLEYQNKIGEMIDHHQENILKLGYAMKMEKLRQELDLREKLSNIKQQQQQQQQSSNSTDDNNEDQQSVDSPLSSSTTESVKPKPNIVDVEEIVKKMSNMNNASHNNPFIKSGSNSSTKQPLENSRKRSSTVVEVKVKEVSSSALLKEDEISGTLKKKSAFREEWKPRYFVFKKPYLYYSHSQKDTHKMKKIDLTNTSVASIPEEEVPFGFAIIQLRRVWLLQASNNQEREKWMQTIDPLRKVTELKDEEIRNAKQEIEKNSSQMHQIKSQLQTSQQIVLVKQKEIEELTNTISQLQLEREVNSQQFDDLREELSVRDQEIKEIKNSQTSQLNNLNGQVVQLNTLNQNREVQISSLTSTIENTNQIIDIVTEQSKNFKNVADMEIDSLRTETLSLRNTNQLLSNRLVELRANIESTVTEKEKQIKELSSKLSFYQSSNQNLLEDTDMKQSQIDILNKTVQQSTKTIQNISEQYQTQSKASEQKMQIKDDQINNINSNYQNESVLLKEQTSQLNSLSSGLRAQIKSLEQTHLAQKESSATEQKSLLLLLNDLEGGLDKASQTITEQSNQIIVLKKELEESRKGSNEGTALLEKQIQSFKERLISSENQLIDRECENTILSDKLKLWEEEIKIKDAKLGLLENNVKEVRAEFANGIAFSKEFSMQQEQFNNTKNNRKSQKLSPEEQMENMRESSIAHQTHNAFLNLQIQRLETEMRTQEKVYNDTIQRIKKDLQTRNQQNIAFMKQQVGDDIVKQMEQKESYTEALKKKYFVSLVVAAKLQNAMMGNICNVDAYEMYEEAITQHILDDQQWPNWVATNLQKIGKNQ
ncbi:hypothetical protein CYY_002915 [Polysphondylium violaceum]|uniref:Kinesin-like protein unc-104 n=1 Tax=Polysphondylium violaceum TaxID=133409 RepID=A0A8J4V6F3_9MYCE|nr:hypothetical protein CYY_002915 [Polysphondylium violaceum]